MISTFNSNNKNNIGKHGSRRVVLCSLWNILQSSTKAGKPWSFFSTFEFKITPFLIQYKEFRKFPSNFEKEVGELEAVKDEVHVIRRCCQWHWGGIQNAAWHGKGAENNGKANQLLSGVLRKRSGKVSFLFGIIVPYNYNEFKMN